MFLEISNNDFVFIGLAVLGLLVFVFVIFSALTKGKNKENLEPESEEFFPDIKPVTKEQQEAKEELERVFNQMAVDLENQNKEERIIDDFEREQEENAIISYQELIAQSKKPQEILDDEVTVIKDVDKPIEKEETEKEINDDFLNLDIDEEPKKFKNSEIISPIFGIQGSPNYVEPKVADREEPRHAYDGSKPEKEEVSENTKFLNSLKAFRENL